RRRYWTKCCGWTGRGEPLPTAVGQALACRLRSAGQGLPYADRNVSSPPLVDERRHQRRPAGLVAGAEAGAVVAVEGLVEQDQVAPVRVLLELPRAAVHRPPAVRPPREDSDHPAGDLLRHLAERDRPTPE